MDEQNRAQEARRNQLKKEMHVQNQALIQYKEQKLAQQRAEEAV